MNLSLRGIITALQAATFVVLGAVLYIEGNSRLGTAQVLLAIITFLVYL